jgi:hypothetical protein
VGVLISAGLGQPVGAAAATLTVTTTRDDLVPHDGSHGAVPDTLSGRAIIATLGSALGARVLVSATDGNAIPVSSHHG